MKPLWIVPYVTYGLKQVPRSGDVAVVFNCIIPGLLISMHQDAFLARSWSRNNAEDGYTLTAEWGSRAQAAGEDVYKLACALQNIRGLSTMYVLPSALIGLGKHIHDHASVVIPKMCDALGDVCGDIELDRVEEHELFFPAIKDMALAENTGVLFPWSRA